jgi:hypothetical protein
VRPVLKLQDGRELKVVKRLLQRKEKKRLRPTGAWVKERKKPAAKAVTSTLP